MSDRAVLVCIRAETGKEPEVPGAMLHKCADCGASVWVSPASLAHIAFETGGVFQIGCMECVAKWAEKDPPTIMPPSSEQLAEFREAFGIAKSKL